METNPDREAQITRYSIPACLVNLGTDIPQFSLSSSMAKAAACNPSGMGAQAGRNPPLLGLTYVQQVTHLPTRNPPWGAKAQEFEQKP